MKNHEFSRVTVTVLGIIGAGFLTAVPSGRGVVNGFADTGNAYKSVGRMIFKVVAPNPPGFPIGTVLNSCTVTLIEPDVALTAGHAWLRTHKRPTAVAARGCHVRWRRLVG